MKAPPMKRPIDVEEDLRRDGGTLIAGGEIVDAHRYVAHLVRDHLAFGCHFERIASDGTRELLDPRLFLRTCSRCARGFFETSEAPALEAVARKRCPSCR